MHSTVLRIPAVHNGGNETAMKTKTRFGVGRCAGPFGRGDPWGRSPVHDHAFDPPASSATSLPPFSVGPDVWLSARASPSSPLPPTPNPASCSRFGRELPSR